MLGRPILLNIPAFPPTAAKLVRVLSRAETATRALEILRDDPAFAAGLIEWANEFFPELDGAIEDVRHVLTLVGFERFRSLPPEIGARLYLRGAPVSLELAPLWRYARSCAEFARRIAEAEGFSPSRASIAAFLHDLGRVGLTVAHPGRYSAFLAEAGARIAAGETFDVAARERELFNTTHYEAGEWLARTWNFPEEVALSAGRHPANQALAPGLIGIVRRACRLALDNGSGFFPVTPGSPPRHSGAAITA